MFEIVKMTHVCQYWRSTLISYPHLWTAVFVQKRHQDMVAACLERSRGAPLTVRLDLTAGDPYLYPNRPALEQVRITSGLPIDRRDPDHCRTGIDPLLEVEQIRRIRKLDVRFSILDWNFENALDGVKFFTSPLPALESLSLHADQDCAIRIYPNFPKDVFRWDSLPPTGLHHLTLRGCCIDPTQAVRNLTSFELSGLAYASYPMELDQHTFLPFISASPSLISLSLAHCKFPPREELSGVTPIRLPELRSLRLMGARKLPSFPRLVDVPAFNTLSSLRMLAHEPSDAGFYDGYILVHAESDDGFQLLYDTSNHGRAAKGFLTLTYNANPSLTFVCFEGRERGSRKLKGASLLPLFVNAEVLGISASFTDMYFYRFWKEHGFWKDLEGVGSQLTTLRLEVTEVMDKEVAKSVENLVEARLQKGAPLARLEVVFGGWHERRREEAKKRWEGSQAGLYRSVSCCSVTVVGATILSAVPSVSINANEKVLSHAVTQTRGLGIASPCVSVGS